MFACLYQPTAPDRDVAALLAIAREFSPRYERHRDDLVSIDVSGLDRLIGPPAVIGEELRRDAAEAPPHALERLPFTTWRRLQRIIEGSQTACVLVGDTPIARSSGGITVRLTRGAPAPVEKRAGVRVDGLLFEGFDLDVEVIRARVQRQENVRVSLSTHCA